MKKNNTKSHFLEFSPTFEAKRFFYFMLLLSSFLCVFLAIISRAWITEDAFITFRVIDHFLHGYGLRWNIDERVQVFTHPLWMFFQIPFYIGLNDPFPTVIISSLVCIAVMMLMIGIHYEKQPWVVLLCFSVPFCLSFPLLEFSTSGLENPLTFLLLTIFFFDLTKPKPDILMLSVWGALIGLNRLDCLIFVIPALGLLWLKNPTTNTVFKLLKGMSPLLLWCGYALFYYGFALPNTYYAKLNTGIATADYIKQGFVYLQGLLHRDIHSSIILFLPLALLFIIFPPILKASRAKVSVHSKWAGFLAWCCNIINHKDAVLLAWIVSIFGSVFYVIYVGGDFMAGRFFTPAMVASLLLLCHVVSTFGARKKREWMQPYLLGLILLVFLKAATLTYWDRYDWKNGVISEWLFYHDYCWLWTDKGKKPYDFVWAEWGRLEGAKAADLPSNRYRVRHFNNVGMSGYYTHPQVVIIDGYGLTEPLLARLPIADKKNWRIGHFYREPPKGYIAARDTGKTDEMQPDLAKYYAALRLITSAPLFSLERLKTLYLWHWGYYEPSLKAYLKSVEPKQ